MAPRWKEEGGFSLSARTLGPHEYRPHFHTPRVRHRALCPFPSASRPRRSFFVSLERTRARIARIDPRKLNPVTRVSCVERQTATCPAGLVDDVLMVILNFSGLPIALGGLVYRLFRALLCGLDKHAFYKGACSPFHPSLFLSLSPPLPLPLPIPLSLFCSMNNAGVCKIGGTNDFGKRRTAP